MINILISVNSDLASSIAIRYAGQLAQFMEVALQPIHVKEPEQKGNLFGTGWVRHTWEHALADRAEEEISLLIRTEKPYCPALAAPRVVVGERESEILKELQTGSYDLLMGGMLASFDDGEFRKLVSSRLYQNMPCPIIVVKNLVGVSKVALLTHKDMDPSVLVEQFFSVFKESNLVLDVVHCVPEKGKGGISIDDLDPQEKHPRKVIDALQKLNWKPQQAETVSGRPKEIADYLSKYGLVACAIRDGLDRKNPIYTILAHAPSPIFLC